MSERIELHAEPRELRGKKVRQLRNEGKTPIVVYGPSIEAVALTVSSRDLRETLERSGTTDVIHVIVDGESESRPTLARAQQLHPTKLVPLHADLLQIDSSRRVSTLVPIRLGDVVPPSVQRGESRLQLLIEHLEVRALPGDLPNELVIDCSKLRRIGQVVRIGDIPLDDGVKILDDPDRAIGRMAALRRAMVIAEDEDEEAGEEEVAEGEEDGEGGEDTRDEDRSED